MIVQKGSGRMGTEPGRMDTLQMQNLVDRFQAGEKEAMNDLLKRVSHSVLSMVQQMVGGYSRLLRWEAVEDIVQNVAMRLVRSLGCIRPTNMRGFYGLVSEQIRRELLDQSRKYYGPHGLGANHDSVIFRRSDGGDPSNTQPEPVASHESVEEMEIWSRFHESVATLPAEEKEVIELFFYQGWTQLQIAEFLQVDPRTIRRRHRAAIDQLATLLNNRFPRGLDRI